MIALFSLAILFTIFVSAICSILEAMLLSTTPVDIERLKKQSPKRGQKLENYLINIEETSSAILSLNTIANTLGATLVGGLAVQIWPEDTNILIKISSIMAISILFFSEIIPKNVGVLYRSELHPFMVFPLHIVCSLMTPLSRIVGTFVKYLLKAEKKETDSDEEIILMAEKSAKDGTLTTNERDMISNALTLDDLEINEIMTPRSVIYAIDEKETIRSLFDATSELPFGRIPLFYKNLDTIIGIVRRRDLLKAKANDQDELKIRSLAQKPIFIKQDTVASKALELFLKHRQQLAIVINHQRETVGVISMEDVIEHLIGEEIFEDDDPAVDMRELARSKKQESNPSDQ